jgi:hypothetical protein
MDDGWRTLSLTAINGPIIQASFSNSLAPNQTMAVVIGDDRLFNSLGVQSGCSGEPLLCDTAYVFRCRVNETDSCDASPWGNTIACATLPCNPGQNACIRKVFGKTIPTFGRCKA